MFSPDNIDFAESKKNILSIRLTPNGFYFSIHCPTDGTVFYQNSVSFSPIEDYLECIEKLIFDYPFFSDNYKKIYVICVDDATTIVPNDYYDKRWAAELLSFNCLNHKSHIISNELQEHDCRVIWGIDKSIHSFLSRALLNPNFVSHLSFLVPLFYKLHNKNKDALFVNFNDNKMLDIVAFSADKLTLAKTFHTSNLLEESYYIQKTWESLQLNVQLDKLFFSGNTSNHSECIDNLKRVVSNTDIISWNVPEGAKINNEEIPTEILKQLCEL